MPAREKLSFFNDDLGDFGGRKVWEQNEPKPCKYEVEHVYLRQQQITNLVGWVEASWAIPIVLQFTHRYRLMGIASLNPSYLKFVGRRVSRLPKPLFLRLIDHSFRVF